jgi:hypothetical protein
MRAVLGGSPVRLTDQPFRRTAFFLAEMGAVQIVHEVLPRLKVAGEVLD